MKKGDILLCVDSTGPGLTVGDLHIALKMNGYYDVDTDQGGCWSTDRFISLNDIFEKEYITLVKKRMGTN